MEAGRKKLRLEGYYYSRQGVYFVTVCTKEKQCLLCDIAPPAIQGDSTTVRLTELGKIVEAATLKIPGIDCFVIMPNHVHLIIVQKEGKKLSDTIRIWKTVITGKSKKQIWQNSYYDHIIRDELDYRIKWKYIEDNPFKWASDDYYPMYSERN